MLENRILPAMFRWIKIPVIQDAPLKLPTLPSARWPVMIFSHGIAGSKNMYSFLLGSLSSHGMIVIAPEHRDGSGPVAVIHESDGETVRVDYEHIVHNLSPEVLEQRHNQMRIRLWELGLVHDALLRLDSGDLPTRCGSENRPSFT